jgi:hypothetical protein
MGRIGTRLFFVSLFLTGCGSVKDSGGPVDAAVDVVTVDADTSGNATVVTEAALFGGTIGANVGDIDIISMLPNNTVLEMKKTDSGGNTTIKVFPGGTVTAVYKHTIDMGADLVTWVGVKPGDTLTFGSRNFSTQGQTNNNLGTQNYTWVAQAGVTQYIIASSSNAAGFGAAATSGGMAEFSINHRDPMDVLFIGGDNTGVTHFTFRSNQAFSTITPITIGGWSVAPNVTVNITGLPPEITNLGGNWATVLDGFSEQAFFGGFNGNPTGGAFTGMFKFHTTGDRTLGRVQMSRTGGFQSMQVVDQFSAGTTTQTVAAPMLTPWLQGSVAASSALRMASWFMVPDATSVHDGVVLRAQWNHVVSATNNFHQWHIIMPPNTQSVVFPKLPAQFNDNQPAAVDSMSVQVKLFDISTVSNYDALRALPSRNIMCTDCALRGGDFTRVVSTGTVQ